MKRFLICVVAIALGLCAMSVSRADDSHNYNGSFCKPCLGSGSGLVEYTPTGIKNVSGKSLWVNCPVLVDEISSTAGTSENFVVWTANKPTDVLQCWFYSTINGGDYLRETKYGYRTGSGWLFLPTLSGDSKQGTFCMQCYVPSQGKLNLIRVTEK